MKKHVDVKSIIIEIVITSIITLIIQSIVMFFSLDAGKIEITQALNESGENDVFIAVRNFEFNEYLEGIIIEIKKDIVIEDLKFSKEKIIYKNNSFEIKQISPNDIETIYFTSKDKLDNDEIKIIKNGIKVRVDSLNDEMSINGSVIVVILMYILISAIISFINSYRAEKRAIEREEFKLKECAILEGKLDVVENKLENDKVEMEKQREILLYYYVEIKDLIKENDYYRKLLKELLKGNEKNNYKKLEEKITNTLKTYTTNDDFFEKYEKLKFLSKKIQELSENEIK